MLRPADSHRTWGLRRIEVLAAAGRAALLLGVGVIVAAIVIATTGFQQADALAGLFTAALIVPRAFAIMRGTGRVLMEYAPEGVDLDEVRGHLEEMEHFAVAHTTFQVETAAFRAGEAASHT